MRNALGIFGLVAGAIVVALVARYGYMGSDTAADGLIAAFFFATIAIGGIAGPAVAVHLFRSATGWARIWGVVAGLVAVVALLANLSNSLGAIAGRADKTIAERTKAADARKDDRAELARITAERAAMKFVPATAEAVSSARESVKAAERTRKAECGDGDAKQRGKNCRQRETEEADARTALTVAIASKEATDRAAKLDTDAATIRARIERAPAVAAVNPLADTLGRILALPAETAATAQQVAMVVVVELLIAFALVAWELLARSLPAAGPLAAVAPPVSAGNVVSILPGDPARFALACLAPSPGKTVAVAELHGPYAGWCARQGQRALGASEFERQFLALAEFAGVRKRKVRGRTVCIDLSLVA